MVEKLRKGSEARFFEEENQAWSASSDFALCLDLSRFPFVSQVNQEDGMNCLRKNFSLIIIVEIFVQVLENMFLKIHFLTRHLVLLCNNL